MRIQTGPRFSQNGGSGVVIVLAYWILWFTEELIQNPGVYLVISMIMKSAYFYRFFNQPSLTYYLKALDCRGCAWPARGEG